MGWAGGCGQVGRQLLHRQALYLQRRGGEGGRRGLVWLCGGWLGSVCSLGAADGCSERRNYYHEEVATANGRALQKQLAGNQEIKGGWHSRWCSGCWGGCAAGERSLLHQHQQQPQHRGGAAAKCSFTAGWAAHIAAACWGAQTAGAAGQGEPAPHLSQVPLLVPAAQNQGAHAGKEGLDPPFWVLLRAGSEWFGGGKEDSWLGGVLVVWEECACASALRMQAGGHLMRRHVGHGARHPC